MLALRKDVYRSGPGKTVILTLHDYSGKLKVKKGMKTIVTGFDSRKIGFKLMCRGYGWVRNISKSQYLQLTPNK